MNKKHLRALESLEKWLGQNDLLTSSLKDSLLEIKLAIQNVAQEEAESPPENLPPPLEISDEPQTVALFSDGGCRGNPGPGAFAFVAQDHAGKVLSEGVEYEAMTTNNKMELSGPLKGLRELEGVLAQLGKTPREIKIKVMTDSKYVVEGMNSWVKGWKARGWKKADGKAPENLELWLALDQVREKFMQVEWVWVKGHAGHPQNEYCDRKANEVLDENRS